MEEGFLGSVVSWVEGAVQTVGNEIENITDAVTGLCTDSGATKPKKYNIMDQSVLGLSPGARIENVGACVNYVDPEGGYNSRCKKLYGRTCYPNNGEFSYADTGSNCSMCNNPDKGYGCKCNSLIIGGKTVLFNRKSGGDGYQAPPLECCRQLPGVLSHNNRIYKNELTCDPKYSSQTSTACTTDSSVINFCKTKGVNIQNEGVCRAIIENPNYPNTGTKNAILKQYCDTSNNMFTRQTCKEWITNKDNQYTVPVRDLVDKYCSLENNIHKEPCKTFIKNYAVNKNPHYDPMMTAWCKNYPNDFRCACIMSKHNEKVAADGTAIQGLPQCVDDICIDLMSVGDGLIPSTMMNPACTYIDCKQFIESNGAIIGDNNKTFATMNMECGTNLSASSVPGGLRTTVGEQGATGNAEIVPPGTEGADKDSMSKEQNIKILILLMLFIVVIAGTWILLSDDSPTVGGVFMNNFNDKLYK
jgi:hypothetical protein